MIKLKDLLYEVISWEDSQLNMMDSTMIPLSKKVVDVIVGDVDIPTFHVTDFKGLVNLKKLQGTSKALSTFTTTSQSNIGNLSGIRTDGGFLVHMIGKLKIASSDDIMSRPDETGRRWVSTEPQFPSSLTYLLNKASDSKIGDKIKGKMTFIFDDIIRKLKLKYKRNVHGLFSHLEDKDGNTLDKRGVKKVFNLYEKGVVKVIKTHQKQLNKHFGEPHPFTGDWWWNELVVDKIMVVDVLGYIEDMYYYDDEVFEDDYNSTEGKQKRKEIEKAKKMFGNKIEITNEPKDINKWISDRGGDAYF